MSEDEFAAIAGLPAPADDEAAPVVEKVEKVEKAAKAPKNKAVESFTLDEALEALDWALARAFPGHAIFFAVGKIGNTGVSDGAKAALVERIALRSSALR